MMPTSYMESLTYEQQLLWLCKYLEETVIPAVNNNAADSPTILPIAKITPVIIPGMALGIKMVCIMCHLPEPSPIAPVR